MAKLSYAQNKLVEVLRAGGSIRALRNGAFGPWLVRPDGVCDNAHLATVRALKKMGYLVEVEDPSPLHRSFKLQEPTPGS